MTFLSRFKRRYYPKIKNRQRPFLFSDIRIAVTILFLLGVVIANAQVSGKVFQDFNMDGTLSGGDIGVAGVTVKAFNASNIQVGATATTAVNGSYSIATGVGSFRIEFSTIPAGFSPTSENGAGTTYQFVTAPSTTANLGLVYPNDYCQANPLVGTSCYINGDVNATAVKNLDAYALYPFKGLSTGNILTQNPVATHGASAYQIGSTWASAYHRKTKNILVGATMRRYMGFGPLGTGGIYKISMTTPSTPSVSNFVDVKTIGIPTGNDTRNGTPANTLSTSPGSGSWDAEAYNQVGKVGIGGMDFSDSGDTLWMINLNDRKLYGIKNINPSVTPTAANVLGGWTVTLPAGYACLGGVNNIRPWAVKYYRGKVYVGVVCSGETTQWDSTVIRGYVLTFDPANTGAGFTYISDFKIPNNRVNYQALALDVYTWSWTNNSFLQTYTYQPIVSDLEFDTDGSIIVGVADRGGLQMGNNNYAADPTASNYGLYSGLTQGDILRICKVGNSYVYEGNSGCANPAANPYPYQEYYWGDTGPYSHASNTFNEVTGGGLAFVPGSGEVLSSAQDPSDWYAGGSIVFNNSTGGDVRRYTLYDQYSTGGSAKSTGVGDYEALCDLAPIEIGNRVWLDINSNGIQDVGESGIDGVVVSLYQSGTLIATTTTANGGYYAFQGLALSTAYEVRIVNFAGQAPIGSKSITPTNKGANTELNSDAVRSGVDAVIAFTSPSAVGQTNYTYDFGFITCSIATVTATNNGPICPAGTVNLTASISGVSGGTWSWTGPGGFTSSLQNPSISNPTVGDYTAIYTVGLCSYAGQTTVSVSPLPTSVAGTNQIQCSNVFTMAATSPSVGTGTWTVVGGAATITTPTSATSAVTVTTSPATLRWTVTSACGTATSNVVLTILPQISITTQPTSINECVGGILTLNVVATGGISPLTYQWQSSTTSGGTYTDITGATSSLYTPSSAATGTTYYQVIVSSSGTGCNPRTSNFASAAINGAPSVSVSVPATTICTNGSVLFTATTLGGVGCSLQWQSSPDGTTWTNIPSATGATYTTPTLSSNMRYRAQFTCTGSGCCSN